MQCSINMGKTCSSHFTEKNRQIGKRKLQVRSEPNLLSLHIFVENFFLAVCQWRFRCLMQLMCSCYAVEMQFLRADEVFFRTVFSLSC